MDLGGSFGRRGLRPLPTVAVVALLSVAAAPAAGSDSGASATGLLEWTAVVNGRDVDEPSDRGTVELRADDSLDVEVTLENLGEEPLAVDRLRLEGRVMGTAFFRFTAGLDVVLEPGEDQTRKVTLPSRDLSRQATGSMPAELKVIDEENQEVAAKNFPVDVRGSVLSAYGIFGFAALVLTAALLLELLVALFRDRLPINRWVRGIRFAAPGLGIGLTLTFFLSVTRLLTPNPEVWLPLVAGSGAAAFLAGYFMPTARVDPWEPAGVGGGVLPHWAVVPRQRVPRRFPRLPKVGSARRRDR